MIEINMSKYKLKKEKPIKQLECFLIENTLVISKLFVVGYISLMIVLLIMGISVYLLFSIFQLFLYLYITCLICSTIIICILFKKEGSIYEDERI